MKNCNVPIATGKEKYGLLLPYTIERYCRCIFGRRNYNAVVNRHAYVKQFCNKLRQMVIDFCTESGIDYHIKDGTITYM